VSMQNTYYVSGKEGFELSFMVDGDIKAGESITAVVEVSETQKQYPLLKRYIQNKLHFSRRFFWVDRDYVLRIVVFRDDRQEDEQRIAVKVADSNRSGSFMQLKELLRQISFAREGVRLIENKPYASQQIAEQLKRYFGNDALDPLLQLLGTADEAMRWKSARVLSWIMKREFLSPVYSVLEQEKEGPVATEIIALIRTLPPDAIQNIAIQTLKRASHGYQRLFAVELLSGNSLPEIREALRDAADFDPDIKVKEKARAALTIRSSTI
jgi:hypothetical protein